MTGKHHIFLTGKKQVGKTTFLKKVLQSWNGTLGGFFTVRTDLFLKDAYSVHLFPAEAMRTGLCPTGENLLFVCGKPGQDTAEKFDRLGCEALEAGKGATLYIMDELGPHEGQAQSFRRAVLQTLSGNTPVLGVLQEAESDFLDQIKEHPNVRVIRITEDNREDGKLFEEVCRALQDSGSDQSCSIQR